MAAPTNQQLIDAIATELLARVTGTSIPDYTMPDGRSIRKIPSDVLERMEVRFRQLAQQDTVAAAGGGTRSYVRFGRPS